MNQLGRRPPVDRPTIKFSDHLTDTPPTVPIVDVAPQLSYPIDLNDQIGCCVVAGLDHALQVIDTALLGSYTNMTGAAIVAAYRTQNPGFVLGDPNHGAGSPDDGGMDVATFLTWATKNGAILGFAKIDHTNPQQMDQAAWLGLAIVTGENLTVAQQTQQVWDTVPGDAEWGGHCTTTVGYPDQTRDTCVTWGALKDMTERFAQQSVEEAWFIITQAHVDHPGFRAGYDLAGFAAEYKALTGRDFPVPVPVPNPNPTPPTPVPAPDPLATFAAFARPWAQQHHIGQNRLMALATLKLLAAENL